MSLRVVIGISDGLAQKIRTTVPQRRIGRPSYSVKSESAQQRCAAFALEIVRSFGPRRSLPSWLAMGLALLLNAPEPGRQISSAAYFPNWEQAIAGHASKERAVFDICGGNYRLIVAFKFSANIAWIKFIGTHAEYDDRVDAATVGRY